MWPYHIDLIAIIKMFKWRMLITWLLVIVENVLLALIPLFIGMSIDGLLAGNIHSLQLLAIVLASITVVSVARRLYDTRAYGQIRVDLAREINIRLSRLPVSIRNARLEMSRELVDFLEEELPPLFTACIQIIASVVILFGFSQSLAVSACISTILMLVMYSLFHQRFIRLNSALNEQKEKQVHILHSRNPRQLLTHLRRLCQREIQLSDAEAILYGVIFLVQFGFIVTNLWLAASLPSITPGSIFSIISYSWEYVESAIMLPVALQTLSRLHEITARINCVQLAPVNK
ncbi:ABC transporter six-transmembrane domain-containing protein [Photobacterium alginatilyticum]|uniref:ABC transporter six-transmembrane domain-containing protein n=1 Tax=Photobacterium alginatilyticum TaxID=1775171 RepID=UPI004068AF74